MNASATNAGALDWVLDKLSAAKKGPVAPVFKPMELKQPTIAAPVYKPPEFETPEEKQKRMAGIREHEFELWKRWKTGGQKAADFEAIMKSHMPIINRRLASFGGVEVNKTAMKSIIVEHYRRALETFNPGHEKGASLSTWVHNNLRGLKRFVVKHQNIARITEPIAEMITPFRTAENELAQRLGYSPTIKQIVDHTHSKTWAGKKLSEKDALQVHKLVKRGLDYEGGGEDVEGAGVRYNDPALQAAHVVYHQLKPHEQKVHELLFPRTGGAPVYKSGTIASKLGWEVSKVSKAKRVILKKIQEHMNG